MKPICTTVATFLALCLPAVAEAKPDGYPLPDPQTTRSRSRGASAA